MQRMCSDWMKLYAEAIQLCDMKDIEIPMRMDEWDSKQLLNFKNWLQNLKG